MLDVYTKVLWRRNNFESLGSLHPSGVVLLPSFCTRAGCVVQSVVLGCIDTGVGPIDGVEIGAQANLARTHLCDD